MTTTDRDAGAPVPDFLIIGAMKAGTTTLYRDLIGHPGLHLPEEKEPETLVRHGDDRAAILADYRSLFSHARPGQLCGEASTAYTKRPLHAGVAERAREICGPNLRLVHLTRAPMKRIISHFKHEYGLGAVGADINHEVLADPKFVDWSRYDWQLEPWIAVFGEEALLRLSFEDYISDRVGTVSRVLSHLGLDLARMPELRLDRAFNASDNKPTAAGLYGSFVNSRFYQRTVKPNVPWYLRDAVARAILPKKKMPPTNLSPSVRAELERRLAQSPEAV
ncbi:MAG: sulfotransferase [Hyphomicrobiales bacterium]